MEDCNNCLHPCEECKEHLRKELDDIECDCGRCNECLDYSDRYNALL